MPIWPLYGGRVGPDWGQRLDSPKESTRQLRRADFFIREEVLASTTRSWIRDHVERASDHCRGFVRPLADGSNSLTRGEGEATRRDETVRREW